MRKCGDRVPKCVICTGPHKIKDHRCGVTSCTKGVDKVCIHLTVQCANCGGGHSANSNQCTLRYKAEKEARRKKTIDNGKANEVETNEKRDKACDEASFSWDIDLETEE